MKSANFLQVIDPLAVDWVELGCRGWDIDETGAGLYGLAGGAISATETKGQPDVPDDAHAHLDFETLDLMLDGPAWFVRRVIDDLIAARVQGLTSFVQTYSNPSGGSIVHGHTWIVPQSVQWSYTFPQ